MKNKCLLLLLFASFPIFSWADETLDSLLHVLDQTILAHDTYVVQRESRIRHLKELAGDVAPNSIERYNLNNQIYKEYKAFICDSAIYYLNEKVAAYFLFPGQYLPDYPRYEHSHLNSK